MNKDEVLTMLQVAEDLRCSKSQVSNLINGRVRGVLPLPSIPLGRRRLVRRSSLEGWKRANERALGDVTLQVSTSFDAIGRTKEA
ncbi:MAG: helix-turn-helix domain-containing protein [Bryobacterales bacterium]|nr:helix-turn-helix domain-containing protein [Bryobacterales bacterium]